MAFSGLPAVIVLLIFWEVAALISWTWYRALAGTSAVMMGSRKEVSHATARIAEDRAGFFHERTPTTQAADKPARQTTQASSKIFPTIVNSPKPLSSMSMTAKTTESKVGTRATSNRLRRQTAYRCTVGSVRPAEARSADSAEEGVVLPRFQENARLRCVIGETDDMRRSSWKENSETLAHQPTRVHERMRCPQRFTLP